METFRAKIGNDRKIEVPVDVAGRLKLQADEEVEIIIMRDKEKLVEDFLGDIDTSKTLNELNKE